MYRIYFIIKIILYLRSMRKHNHIIALFFLGIFSMFLWHQIVPHLHHQYEDSHTAVKSADAHDHHHDTPEKEDNSKSGFFDFFLDMHIHVGVSDDLPVIRQLTKKWRVVDHMVSGLPALYKDISLKDAGLVEKRAVYHPPNNYFNPFTTNLNLRGPPDLG